MSVVSVICPELSTGSILLIMFLNESCSSIYKPALPIFLNSYFYI